MYMRAVTQRAGAGRLTVRKAARAAVEPLETRQLLSAAPQITSFGIALDHPGAYDEAYFQVELNQHTGVIERDSIEVTSLDDPSMVIPELAFHVDYYPLDTIVSLQMPL